METKMKKVWLLFLKISGFQAMYTVCEMTRSASGIPCQWIRDARKYSRQLKVFQVKVPIRTLRRITVVMPKAKYRRTQDGSIDFFLENLGDTFRSKAALKWASRHEQKFSD